MKTLVALAALAAAAPAFADDAAQIERGAYLARIMDCAGCHMPRGADGAPIVEAGLSGGNVGFEAPGLGAFWPPNLTPHETGLAGWSKTEIVAAIREGVRPDGRVLAPMMPWPNYAALTDADADALAAYLMSLAPVDHPTPAPVASGEEASAPFYRVTVPD
jgi:mono/diheme cytochrome c family protein